MSKINDRWSALSMKDRAALIDIYVKSGITDLGEIRKSYNGIPYRDFNTSEYDYFNAHPDNAPTKEGEHWTSRNPKTGRLLKREGHPTFDLMIEGEKQAGYKIIRGYNGELYSIPNEPTNYVEDYNSFDEGGDIESIVYEEGIEDDVPNYNNVYTLSRDTGDYMKNWYSQRQNIGLNSFYNKVVDEYNTKYENDLIIPKVKAPVGTNNKVGEYVVAPGSNGIVTKNPFYYEKDLEVAKDYLKDFNRRSGNFKVRFDNTSRYAGRYDPNEGNLIHISTKVPNDAKLNYAVHEATHSLTNRDFNFDSDYLGHLPKDNTYYFGNPSEQYARVMQLRNYLNLDPNKVYTEDEVNKIRDNIEFKYPNTREHLGDNLLFIYSNKEIADMLNNSFDDGGDLDTLTTEEPIYYDDTYIEPAVVKAFNSAEEYNRYQGKKGAKAVRRGMNKATNTIAEGLRYTPVVGDVMDGVEAYEEAKTGNLTKAGVLAGLALLPNALEKPIKAVSKPLKRYLTHGIDNDLFTLSMKKWKGSPMPSMSVNDLDIPIFDYGDMTFIGSEDLLDNSIIFRGDGLTPTIGTVGGNEMMDPQEVIKRMKEQQKRKGEYNIGQIISKEEASTLPMRGGTEDYFEAKYQDFIPWNKFKHLVTKGELHPDLIKLIEDVGIPHTNVPEENYLEAIRKIAEEMNLVFNKGGKLNKFVTGGPTKNNWEIPFSLESTTVPITNYDYYTFVPEAVQIPISALKEKYAMAPELIARNDEEQLRELKERASKEYSYGIKSKILDNIGKQEEVNKSMLRSGYHNNQPDNYGYTDESEVDTSKQIKITAPNTNISKFIYGNTITEEALKEIKRVASTRNLDPYDILAHMLIESSGNFGGITYNTYFNTHDVLERQINPKLLDTNNSRNIETLLKNLGVYDPAKQYTNEQIKDYILKYIKQLKEANANVEYPTSTIDAVGLRMSKFGRDFNPAQKGFKSDLGEIKHSYLEMIDSAIASLKENMPDLFK